MPGGHELVDVAQRLHQGGVGMPKYVLSCPCSSPIHCYWNVLATTTMGHQVSVSINNKKTQQSLS